MARRRSGMCRALLLVPLALIASTAFSKAGAPATPKAPTAHESSPLLRPLHRDSAGKVPKEAMMNASAWAIMTETEDYREADRLQRHVVYGYQDWVDHRSPERYFRNLLGITSSSMYRGMWQEVLITVAFSVVVVVFCDADFAGVARELGLPGNILQVLAGFALTWKGFASTLPLTATLLSLLLVFKTNAAYGRWWEARQIWGSITNKCRDLARQVLARMTDEDEEIRVSAAKLVVAYPFALRFHLGEKTSNDATELTKKMEELLTPSQIQTVMSAEHKPMTILGLLSDTMHCADLGVFDKMKIDQVLSDLTDYYGMCERIFKTPMPLQYTRLTGRFLSFWLFGLSIGLVSTIQPHWLVIAITFFVSSFAFAIEDLSVQLEEPFSIQPLLAQAEGVQVSIFEALELKALRRVFREELLQQLAAEKGAGAAYGIYEDEHTHFENLCKDLQSEIQSMDSIRQERLGHFKSQIEQVKAFTDERMATLEEQRKAMDQVSVELERLCDGVLAKDAKKRAMNKDASKLVDEMMKLREELVQKRGQFSASQERLQGLRTEVEQLDDALTNLTAELATGKIIREEKRQSLEPEENSSDVSSPTQDVAEGQQERGEGAKKKNLVKG